MNCPPKKAYTFKEAFGLDVPMSLNGFEDHPFAPPRIAGYHFHVNLLRDMIGFLRSGSTAACFIGERGTGKTSFVEQFHAALRLPIITVQASADMLSEKLLGQWVMNSDKSMTYRYAGVLLAAKLGIPVLIDEINLVPPGILSVINRLMEGYSYDCPETGERITPTGDFKVFGTCNPPDGVQYKDREEFDAALEDRFVWIRCEYPKPEEEIPLVAAVLATMIPDETVRNGLATSMVAVANDIRDRHMSRSTTADSLRTVMSTRVLLRWARFSLVFHDLAQKGISPVHYALERVLTGAPSVDEREKAAIHEIVQLRTGQVATTTAA